jgi:hypothetical protein
VKRRVERETMTENKTCVVCGVVLDSENYWTSYQKKKIYICKECSKDRCRLWNKANPERAKAIWARANHKRGRRPFNENKECGMYLGVHVAERVLSHVFKDVERMPMNNPGYDFICNRDKLIDVKSSCKREDGRWSFNIRHNTTADFFICLAFDNRKDLIPLYAWLIPRSKFNNLVKASICLGTISKWDEYMLDISKVSICCDAMRLLHGRSDTR